MPKDEWRRNKPRVPDTFDNQKEREQKASILADSWLARYENRKHKKEKTKKPRRHSSATTEAEIREKVRPLGFTLTVSIITAGKNRKKVPHWIFRRDGRAVLHFWPSTGKWRDPVSEEQGVVTALGDILTVLVPVGETSARRSRG